MTSGHPHDSTKGTGPRLFRGRRPGPLLGPWLGGTIVAGLIYAFSRWMPAFEVVVRPFYWIILAIVVAFSLRWIRGRSGKRRGADRRQEDRRGSD